MLDAFMGSGSLGLSCKRLERHFIGIDQSPVYCEQARKRITNEE